MKVFTDNQSLMGKKGVIWLINKEAAPSNEYATHMRTIRQAQFFKRNGWDVKLFCSAVIHNTNIVHTFSGPWHEEEHDGVPMVFVKSPQYGDSTIKRVWSFVVFSLNMFRTNELPKPDIIIHESKTPFDIMIYRLAKNMKARYIVDIEDLWPFEFERMGILSKKNPILRLFYSLERYIYTKGEHVVISTEGGRDYIKHHKWDIAQGGPINLDKVHYVNNGISLEEFKQNSICYRLDDPDLDNKDVFKVIYLGSIRLANDLNQLLDAAQKLQKEKRIKILIYGDGTERPYLEKRCKEEHIDNVVFKNKWIELKFVPYVLSQADLHILNYGKNWAPFGGSMNKMMMAFASGKPMVCNADLPYSEINRHNLGVDKVFNNPEEYAQAIKSIYDMPKNEYEEMCNRVKEVAKRYDINYLCERFAEYCEIK